MNMSDLPVIPPEVFFRSEWWSLPSDSPEAPVAPLPIEEQIPSGNFFADLDLNHIGDYLNVSQLSTESISGYRQESDPQPEGDHHEKLQQQRQNSQQQNPQQQLQQQQREEALQTLLQLLENERIQYDNNQTKQEVQQPQPEAAHLVTEKPVAKKETLEQRKIRNRREIIKAKKAEFMRKYEKVKERVLNPPKHNMILRSSTKAKVQRGQLPEFLELPEPQDNLVPLETRDNSVAPESEDQPIPPEFDPEVDVPHLQQIIRVTPEINAKYRTYVRNYITRKISSMASLEEKLTYMRPQRDFYQQKLVELAALRTGHHHPRKQNGAPDQVARIDDPNTDHNPEALLPEVVSTRPRRVTFAKMSQEEREYRDEKKKKKPSKIIGDYEGYCWKQAERKRKFANEKRKLARMNRKSNL